MQPAPLLIPSFIVVTALLAIFLAVRRLLRLRNLPIRKFRRSTERVILSVVTLAALIACVSTTFNVAAHEDLKKLSTRSRRIIAKGSGHYIQLYRSDLLLKEVPPFIEQVGNAPPPLYGTTTTE